MKKKYFKFLSIASLLFLITSCKKNDVVSTPSPRSASTLANATVSNLGAVEGENDNDIDDVSDDYGTSSCAVITFSPSNDHYPYIKTIDYGSGCTDDNGVTRTGKKFISMYGNQEKAAAGRYIYSIAYSSNYTVNGVGIGGYLKVMVDTAASSGTLTLKVFVNKQITDSAGNVNSYYLSQNRTRIGGAGTTSTSDDVYQVSINHAQGAEVSGDSTMFTWRGNTDNTNPIIKSTSCMYRQQGVLQIILKHNNDIYYESLDYGNGDCDDQATVTVNGGTPQAVTLPLNFYSSNL